MNNNINKNNSNSQHFDLKGSNSTTNNMSYKFLLAKNILLCLDKAQYQEAKKDLKKCFVIESQGKICKELEILNILFLIYIYYKKNEMKKFFTCIDEMNSIILKNQLNLMNLNNLIQSEEYLRILIKKIVIKEVFNKKFVLNSTYKFEDILVNDGVWFKNQQSFYVFSNLFVGQLILQRNPQINSLYRTHYSIWFQGFKHELTDNNMGINKIQAFNNLLAELDLIGIQLNKSSSTIIINSDETKNNSNIKSKGTGLFQGTNNMFKSSNYNFDENFMNKTSAELYYVKNDKTIEIGTTKDILSVKSDNNKEKKKVINSVSPSIKGLKTKIVKKSSEILDSQNLAGLLLKIKGKNTTLNSSLPPSSRISNNSTSIKSPNKPKFVYQNSNTPLEKNTSQNQTDNIGIKSKIDSKASLQTKNSSSKKKDSLGKSEADLEKIKSNYIFKNKNLSNTINAKTKNIFMNTNKVSHKNTLDGMIKREIIDSDVKRKTTLEINIEDDYQKVIDTNPEEKMSKTFKKAFNYNKQSHNKAFEFNDYEKDVKIKDSHFINDTLMYSKKISTNEDEKTEFSKTINSFDKTINSKKTDQTNNETSIPNLKDNVVENENSILIRNEIYSKIENRLNSIQYSISLIENESNNFKLNNLNIRNLLDSII